MTSIQVPVDQDEQDTLHALDSLGVYCNKTRLYKAALREGLKALALEHVPSVLAERRPENQLLAEVFAGGVK